MALSFRDVCKGSADIPERGPAKGFGEALPGVGALGEILGFSGYRVCCFLMLFI